MFALLIFFKRSFVEIFLIFKSGHSMSLARNVFVTYQTIFDFKIPIFNANNIMEIINY